MDDTYAEPERGAHTVPRPWSSFESFCALRIVSSAVTSSPFLHEKEDDELKDGNNSAPRGYSYIRVITSHLLVTDRASFDF
jgi:hypothetical protein